MFDFSVLTDEELKLCYKQKKENKYNEAPLKFVKQGFDGQLAGVWLEQHLLEEIANRYCQIAS